VGTKVGAKVGFTVGILVGSLEGSEVGDGVVTQEVASLRFVTKPSLQTHEYSSAAPVAEGTHWVETVSQPWAWPSAQGDTVGRWVGSRDGVLVGELVGPRVGLRVGFMVGAVVGSSVGSVEGCCVGAGVLMHAIGVLGSLRKPSRHMHV